MSPGPARTTIGWLGLGAAGLSSIGATYLTIIGWAATRSHHAGAPEPRDLPNRRLRVLVPAHDEEGEIEETLRSIAACASPTLPFEIHVVADNCTDNTAEVAAETGVFVHERRGGARGKGPALAWLIDELPAGAPDDVFVFIDADSRVDPSFMTAMTAELGRGCDVAQAFYTLEPTDDGGVTSTAFAVRHYVRPLGRTWLGGSASLYGNGMAMLEKTAATVRWTEDLAEDLEMSVQLLLGGELIGFARDARVSSRSPSRPEAVASQRRRWEAGRFSVARRGVPRLLEAARRQRHARRWVYIDAAIDLALPPMSMLVASGITGTVLASLGSRPTRRAGVPLGLSGLGQIVLHVLLALKLTGAPASSYRNLARAPAVAVRNIHAAFEAVRRPPEHWERTARTQHP